jgi:hypothetical protein
MDENVQLGMMVLGATLDRDFAVVDNPGQRLPDALLATVLSHSVQAAQQIWPVLSSFSWPCKWCANCLT